MNPPLVSVLVTTYNAAPYLPELCASIQAQTYPNFEVLVWDDGSTDDTKSALAPFTSDPRFQIMGGQPNRGVNVATSALFPRMKGEFWCNPGADDVLLPDFIASRVEKLQANPNAVMIHGPCQRIDKESKPLAEGVADLKLPAITPGPRALAILMQHNIVNHPSVMLRSAITRRIAPLYECDWKCGNDWFLWILHLATAHDLLWDDRVLHKYRIHPGSLSFVPEKFAYRHAEFRLAPLCAFSAASGLSESAAALWKKWRHTLYHNWLIRAVSLSRKGLMRQEWTTLGAQAYYGPKAGTKTLFQELLRHAPGIVATRFKEKSALNRQHGVPTPNGPAEVTGVAQIDDEVFR